MILPRLSRLAWVIALMTPVACLVDILPARPADFQTHAPGALKDDFGKGTVSYSSYAPGMRFPIINYPSTVNSQVRNKGSKAYPGDQCHEDNYNEVWADTLCETRGAKDSPPLGCVLKTVHQGVDIRGGTTKTCKELSEKRQNLVPVAAVRDGTIAAISTYTVDLVTKDGEKFRYLHMNMQGLPVKKNQSVTAGEIIGYMYKDFGGTPTTFHLHLEHWKAIDGVGFVPVPLYCDLIAAYERDQSKTSEMIGGGPRCEASSATTPPPQPAEEKISSYWRYGTAEVGLMAEGGSRTFVTSKSGMNGGPAVGDVVFKGLKQGESYQGVARIFGDDCGSEPFDVKGPILNGGLRVDLTGSRTKKGSKCSSPGASEVSLSFDFLRKFGEDAVGAVCGSTISDRKSKTELTKNWGAITMYVPHDGWLPYIKKWPGLLLGSDGKPVDVQIDKLGGTIMAFETDEAGVGLWWYWLLVRKGYGADGKATGAPTFTEIAKGIAGSTAKPAVIQNYVDAYVALSERYFGKRLGANDRITLADADQLWALGQTMFHHESGRTPLIDRPLFERGIAFGTDQMQGKFKGVEAYVAKCMEGEVEEEEPAATPDEKDQQIEALQATNARLNALIEELQQRLTTIGKLASQ